MFHFFADVDALGAQGAADAFGPVAGAASTQFRVTSVHKPLPGAAPNAYAVCDGLLLAQDAGGNLLNLILKPTEQPPFAFPKIKFFVYRGVKKGGLVSGSAVASATNNDLAKSIWDSQRARNDSAGTSDDAPAEALGLDVTGGGPIEDAFYRENVSYQLPLVRSGWSLGEFDATQFGFEIMVESIGFDPGLPTVRTPENVVNVAALPASPTQAQEFEHWHDKEAVLNYIDPCAFFGGFYFDRLRVHYAGGSASKKKRNELYDDVLKGSHLGAQGDGVFFNRNRTYLDVRNEHNHSLNYFKNYGTFSNTDIKLGFDANAAPPIRNYYAGGWPLLTLDNGDLPTANTSSKNIIRLCLPDGGGENPLPTLYVSSGHLSALYPRAPKDKARLIDLVTAAGFTSEVVLAIPNNGSLQSTTAVSSYIRLKYCKRLDPAAPPPASSGTAVRAANYLDNLFAPFDMRAPSVGSPGAGLTVYDDERVIFVTSEPGRDHVARLGFAADPDYVTLLAYPVITRTAAGDAAAGGFHLSGRGRGRDNSFLEEMGSGKEGTVLLKGSLKDSGSDIPFLRLGRGLPERQAGGGFLNPDDFIAVTITGAEYATLANMRQSNFSAGFRTYLGVVATNKTDDDARPFVQLDLVLRGFHVVGGSTPAERYEVNEVGTGLRLYSHGTI